MKLSIIKQHLVHGIKSRQFKDKLPSENELARKFQVSRMTARKVLSDIEAEGRVERIQGKGTFIKKHELLVSKYDLPLTHAWQRVTAEIMPDDVCEVFGGDAGQAVFHIERITHTFENPVTCVTYFIKGEVAFEDSFVPHSPGRQG